MKIDNFIIIAGLKSEPTCKLIKKYTRYASFDIKFIRLDFKNASLKIQQAFSKPCLVNLISKDTHLIFSIFKYVHSCKHTLSTLLTLYSIGYFLIMTSFLFLDNIKKIQEKYK